MAEGWGSVVHFWKNAKFSKSHSKRQKLPHPANKIIPLAFLWDPRMNEYKGHISFKCTWIKVKHHTAYFWMKAPFFHTECFEYISIIVEKQNMSNGDKRSAIIFKSFLGVCKIELFKQHIYRWNNPCSIENSKWRGTFMKY